LSDLLKAIQLLLIHQQRGCWNLGGPEAYSRLELALRVAETLNLPTALIHAISLADLHEPFQRPRDTRLDITRFQSLFPDWKATTLKEVLIGFKE
jgi:dTDP-4-dehydrorhamnose reductase